MVYGELWCAECCRSPGWECEEVCAEPRRTSLSFPVKVKLSARLLILTLDKERGIIFWPILLLKLKANEELFGLAFVVLESVSVYKAGASCNILYAARCKMVQI
jgi:hypothetical protein